MSDESEYLRTQRRAAADIMFQAYVDAGHIAVALAAVSEGKATPAQAIAAAKQWAIALAGDNPPASLAEFTERLSYAHHVGCVMYRRADCWLGIEPDGYTHS